MVSRGTAKVWLGCLGCLSLGAAIPETQSGILSALADPNLAYLLLSLGFLGLLAELYQPGMIVPGVLGALALLLAFVLLASLPTNWAGILLLFLAAAFFVAELFTEGFGPLAVGGLLAFIAGSLLLFRPLPGEEAAQPGLSVSPWLVATMSLGVTGFFLLVGRAVFKASRTPVSTGAQAMIGRVGVATSDLTPAGVVRVEGEAWSAVSEDGPIEAGKEVQVIAVEGVTLKVIRY